MNRRISNKEFRILIGGHLRKPAVEMGRRENSRW
ncbi:MAG: hypothetical protein ACI9MB_000602, partial [Verrucomicrobiales bacterium]